ncbi:MAG: glycogen/starch/alpha-glucan phosphorylase [Balneolaceae bacterium]|nr:glycogen/starch/alpha-glucan phosphorylase [Balneolaceae bacterium]
MSYAGNGDLRTGMNVDAFREDIKQHLYYTLAKDNYSSTEWDIYQSVVLSVMDRLHDRWIRTQQTYYEQGSKRVYYLSMEYLIGRLLDNMLINLGLQEVAAEAFEDLGLDYDAVREAEVDAGLGNGGLGRLAACYLDSMATLGIPAIGYGIRYDYGIFDQEIRDGYQVEQPDLWLQYGYPWGVVRPKIQYPIPFYGETEAYEDGNGDLRYDWVNTRPVIALAYDTPIPGYGNDKANHLRLWKAVSSHSLDLERFNEGNYVDAIRENLMEENISRVLYPNDKVMAGQELRLKQEYFLVASSLKDAIRRFKKQFDDLRRIPEKVAVQCNDTHPLLAIPELMRMLLDEEKLNWEQSWEIVTGTIHYTNHTLLPEALEKWPMTLMGTLLPRHAQIIREIDRRFVNSIEVKGREDAERRDRMRVVTQEMNSTVRMGNLGVIGSRRVNGVSQVHGDLMKETTFRDFYEEYPEKFTAITNGVTPRRWLRQCNPELSELISGEIGEEWVRDLDRLEELEGCAEDARFLERFEEVKQAKKAQLAGYIKDELEVEVPTGAIFDIQVKRIHEYKRQLMAALHAAALYNEIKENPGSGRLPRVLLFAGKAAPGYAMAKLHVKLITSIAETINGDPDMQGQLHCVFLPNYSVSLAERMIPAANLSEQISTAGMEASGTGNMKFALNGALTVGTWDGANIEMAGRVGEEHIFIFGNDVEQVEALRNGPYRPAEKLEELPRLRQVLDQLREGYFCPEEPDLFQPVINSLLNQGDYFMVLADFASYWEKQLEIEEAYRDREGWNRSAVRNVAGMGYFSSDRSIREYAREIWQVPVDG